jgi:hypothetical protein
MSLRDKRLPKMGELLKRATLDISRPVCKSLKIQMDVRMRREGLAWIYF